MQTLPLTLLFVVLITLILCSAFFSGSETAMMAINRYRLRHLAKGKNKSAQRVERLLKRPDRLLGAILIGNTFSNILASALATVIAVQLFGEIGILIGAILLTLVVLIFAEVLPKTLAAHNPQKVSFIAGWPLGWLLILFYPLVWSANAIVNNLLRLMGVQKPSATAEHLNIEELRTIVSEQSKHIPAKSKSILLRLIDLKEMQVDDIMVPRNEIVGIDLQEDWQTIAKQLANSQHTRLLIYQDSLDNVVGMLHMRDLMPLISQQKFDKDSLIGAAEEVYYVPEGTTLMTQLTNFQSNKQRIGLVVDEYGDILGLVTLEDILEEVIGEYTTDIAAQSKLVHSEKDGSYVIEAGINIRELNRDMGWELPTDGPKTLSGAIIEYLEVIPGPGTGVRLNGYPIEVLRVAGNKIHTVRILPRLRRVANDSAED